MTWHNYKTGKLDRVTKDRATEFFPQTPELLAKYHYYVSTGLPWLVAFGAIIEECIETGIELRPNEHF